MICALGWYAAQRSYPGAPRFPQLTTIAMVESRIERGDKTEWTRSPAADVIYCRDAMNAATEADALVQRLWSSPCVRASGTTQLRRKERQEGFSNHPESANMDA